MATVFQASIFQNNVFQAVGVFQPNVFQRNVFQPAIIDVVVTAPGGGLGFPRRPLPQPLPIEGVAFGELPQLEGEAIGTVIVAGRGLGNIPDLGGIAVGAVGTAGRSSGEILIRATATGNRGQAGTAVAVLKAISVASKGAAGARGLGLGVIANLKATASGQFDDVEAAAITFLFAA